MLKLLFHTQLQLGFAQAAVAALAAFVVGAAGTQAQHSPRGRNTGRHDSRDCADHRGWRNFAFAAEWAALDQHLTSGRHDRRRGGYFGAPRQGNTGRIPSLFLGNRIRGPIIAIMSWLGVIDTAITSLVPVGSMLIANAMNTNGLALNRFRSDVLAHVGEVETALALGAEARNSVSPYVEASFEASLIPAIDSLRSLGIVWIPGLMAGMLLSGARPIYAAIYQFVLLAMIFASSGLTSLVSTSLIRGRIFSPAEQLTLQPGR
jgi:hypothetical protein